ncbi:hypothetical protein [Mesomycoplasma bovoculi]|uniref:Putative phase variable surface protein VpbA n=1 Tax=Mesomycoplasma bovoculi M165/69 TaxID=743966 RepID=W5UT91_9BACT|nr:hypothetical protein [Mesomycoplasma bovoculi]AHH45362.1 putative phase variable surface protein VpbA [Mesomycoplasma bovoculi M165/69]
MTKKSKLIIAGSTVLAGTIITGIAVPLSQKANQPTPEQKQEQEKIPALTEENKGQVDSQKDSTEDKQQNSAEAGSGEKTEENSAQEETKPQVDSQKDSTEDKQQNGAEAGSGEKTEENSAQEETKPQVDLQNNSTEDKQQNGEKAGSGGKTEENNKVTEPMKSQVDSQNNGNGNQQNNGEIGKKVENSNAVESSEQKGTELKSKLTPVILYFFNGDFFLRLLTSKATFEKIKNDRLAFTLDKGGLKIDELASEFPQSGHTSYYRNYYDEPNGNVSFEIISNRSYGSDPKEKGKYKVTKVWLSNDSSKTNLLDKESNTEDVK